MSCASSAAMTYPTPLLMSVSGAELDVFLFVEFDVEFDKSQRKSSMSLIFLCKVLFNLTADDLFRSDQYWSLCDQIYPVATIGCER